MSNAKKYIPTNSPSVPSTSCDLAEFFVFWVKQMRSNKQGALHVRTGQVDYGAPGG